MIFITTSIEEVLPSLTLYPNPTARLLYIEIPGSTSGIARLELLDNTGKILESREVSTASTTVFDLKEYRNGMLLIKIMLDEKTIVRKILTY